MRLTQQHLNYWRQRQRQPGWVSKIKRSAYSAEQRVSIDEIVNANAGIRPSLAAHNTLSLLSLARKNGDLLNCMWRCAFGPHRGQHVRRSRWCEKWLRKLGHERVEQP